MSRVPDPDDIFQETGRDVIVRLVNSSGQHYVFGSTGRGKTIFLKQLAARPDCPVFEATGHGRLEFRDMVGHLSVRDGNMEFRSGPPA